MRKHLQLQPVMLEPGQQQIMQSQGRQQQVRHPQNRQQQDRQQQARHQESQQEDLKQYQQSSQQKSRRKMMDPPSQSFIDLSTMEALEYEDGNASHIAVIHVSDPQQPDPMQSQGRSNKFDIHKTDSNKTDNNKLDIKNPNRKIQNNIKNQVNRKVVGRRWIHLPNHSSIFRQWKPWNTKTETVNCHLTLLLFTFLTHNNRIRDLEAIVYHRQLLSLFAIPPCIHLTKNSSKRQLPLSVFIVFLVLQTICRLPFRCCTDMQNMLPSFIVTRDFWV